LRDLHGLNASKEIVGQSNDSLPKRATCPRQKGRLTLPYAASSAQYAAIPDVPSKDAM